MPDQSSSRVSAGAATLLLLVASLILAPFGAFVFEVVAQVMGGNNPPGVLASPDPVSDAVSATGAEFRVDESGAATYSVPLYTVPGTAGVVPKLSLSYSSQGGYGALGKGWSIGGLSSISRCRATREGGDFLGAATPDGNPRPVNFSTSDRYCLDGQRLLPSSTTCPSAGGMSGVAHATELESFSRICAYSAAGSSTGPAFFTVERKDGSISWYGDRDSSTGGATRPDGYVETTSPLSPGAAMLWVQTRFQDSTGNYIDYLYNENPGAANTGEIHVREVRYTGRAALAGQSTGASAPYAKVQFNYTTLPTAQWSRGYVAGGVVATTQRLESITSCATVACTGADDQVRHVLLTYAPSPSGSQQDTLIGLQECRSSSAAVCSAATLFGWSTASHSFTSYETPANLSLATDHFKGFKVGDINGDGRQDLAVLYLAGTGCQGGSWIVSMLGTQDGAGRPTYGSTTFNCVPANITARGDGAWHLLDYNGDGLDDLFVSSYTGQGWRVHPSNGTHFDMTTNLIAGLSPVIASAEAETSQVQLADLNGDGLTDIVYPGASGLRARLMERQAGAFVWGSERTTVVDESTLGPIALGCDDPFNPDVRNCERTISGTPTTKTGFLQMVDFNGDAASDLLIRITTQAELWTNFPGCEREPEFRRGAAVSSRGVISRYEDPDEPTASMLAAPPDPCWEQVRSDDLYALTVDTQDANALLLSGYDVVSSGNPYAIVFADLNGDGLSDRLLRGTASGDWAYALNTGRGFLHGGILTLSDYRDQARFVDVTGDGRADMLYLVNYGSYKAYAMRRALPEGGFASGTALPGGNARLCQGSGCNQQQRVPIFSDTDGDGNLDFLALDFSGSNVGLAVSRGPQTFQPRDVITTVTNGLGAVTQLQYAPLTNSAVYRRNTGSRNNANWGRGAPVQDMLTSSYVVARASSSAPRAGDTGAMANLYYRYANGRIQAGGRGFLGFGTIETIDPNQSGGHVVTTTHYAQNFPFIGLPMQTLKKAISGSYTVPTCLVTVPNNACFSGPGIAHSDLGGQWFSNGTQSWEMAPSTLSNQVAIHVRTQGTEETLRDPFTGLITSKIASAFSYGANGNVTQTVVDTYTGMLTLTATQITQNTYSDDTTNWRLGRLTASTVTHRRPGYTDVVRTTGFSYALGLNGTGLLTEERTQPGGPANLASAIAHTLDDYGNRTQSVSCAAPATGCSLTGFAFRPSALDAQRRYSRVEYDAQGRFPVATYEPFGNGGSGQERRTSFVAARNEFGDATTVFDVNNVRSLVIKGGLGRDYFTWTQTTPYATPGNGGSVGLVTYRWCATGPEAVACPTGAVFRQQTAATAAPRQWKYFDVLGRPIMAATETFNVGVSDQDVSAVCTEYDGVGRVSRTSTPFFLSGTAGTTGPTDVTSVCSSPSRAWALNQYDLLGRPVLVQAADGSQVVSQYAGLATTTIDERNNPSIQVRNGKGELASTQDASGFVTQFAYRADGNLVSVTRDAGNGVITNSFDYDALGRKIQQVDPDTGTTTFEYNAFGELVAQTDNEGYRTERDIDARGRAWRFTAKLPGGVVETQATTDYDTFDNTSGLPISETITGQYASWSGQSNTEVNYTRYFSYDAMGRPTSTFLMLAEGFFSTEVQYDTLGRPWKSRDASGVWSKTEFGNRGPAASCASDGVDNSATCGNTVDTYTRTLATDAWGNVVREIRGGQSNLEVRRQHHPLSGRVTEVCGGNISCNIMQEAYVWDAAGNLSSHQKEGRYLEQFTYDSLNRVVEGRLMMANGSYVNQVLLTNAYDQLGNVCSKDGLGYAYPGADGCVGALPMAQAVGVPSLAARLTPVPLREARNSVTEVSASGHVVATTTHRDGTGRLGLDDGPSSRLNETPLVGREPPNTSHKVEAATKSVKVAAAAFSAISSPHAVSQVGAGSNATFYYYDDRGNQTMRDAPGTTNDRTISYTASGRAHEIALGNGQTTRFWYGPDGKRYKRTDGTTTTLYVDGVEFIIQNGVQTARRYAAGVALQTVANGAVQSTRYLFHDHLGSLVRVANPDGTVAEALDYTTFGDRRSYGNPSGSGAASNYTPRGYTGHEYVDGAQVTHMNGRIYDQQLGRFLQADPLVQSTGNGQSWNAYTYVYNNPLAYTDPTGMFSIGRALFNPGAGLIRGAMRMLGPNVSGLAVGVGCSYVPGPWAIACAAGGSYDLARTFGASPKEARKAAVAGAFTAAVGYGLDMHYGGEVTYGRVAISALAGGVAAEIQGGKFGNGFVSAGLTTLVMPQVGYIQNDFLRTVVGAIVGGTISDATGGKFANGAISGAIQGALAKRPLQDSLSGGGSNAFGSYTDEIPQGFAALKEKYPAIEARMASYWESSFDGYFRREYGMVGIESLDGAEMRYLHLDSEWSIWPQSFGYKSMPFKEQVLRQFAIAGLNPAEWNIRFVYHTHPFNKCFSFCGPNSSGFGPSSGDQGLTLKLPDVYHVVRQMTGTTPQGVPTYVDLYYGQASGGP
ncbi:RHS repeat-associated core domain-containing protein [Pseudoxanthomonas sp. CF385]|uniref:toxin TcdB middle/N-terminal domain-containing protein n=1 Tax=Pseudoxanthomonas sp. CF385 TaxID=1881042 RepID=UPI000885B721|nr:toxin TcdB middle/N-terminal domain-containing protein [Pseudoxanthomonas sp. CF385]SDQ63855.1 RHS repeat-associated core domain-containing protein [Pseudoxanthomonas sp. CF385]